LNKFFLSLALSIVMLSMTLPAAAKTIVTLGVTEGAATGAMGNEMKPVMAHLGTSKTLDFQLKVFPNHDALYTALKAGKVDLAFLGAVKYVEAHDEIGAIPLFAEGEKVRSYLVVPPNSSIKTPEELKGKSIAFGYPDSTTTHLIPLLLLSKHGIKETDIKSAFLGHQPQVLVDQMLAGKFAACPVSQYMLEKNKTRVRIIEQSDLFSGPPIVARKDFDPKKAAEVLALFLSYKATGEARGDHFGNGVTVVTDTDYNRIRFLCKVLFNKTYH
jgi:phosphonate transport system substrate-binding protein